MNVMGHRYHCTSCGSEVIVTKPADGELGCCKRLMKDLTQAELDAQKGVGETGPRPSG